MTRALVAIATLQITLLLITLLPCGMPTAEGDRSLMSVIDEIESKGNAQQALTPEQIEAINAQNEARAEEILKAQNFKQ